MARKKYPGVAASGLGLPQKTVCKLTRAATGKGALRQPDGLSALYQPRKVLERRIGQVLRVVNFEQTPLTVALQMLAASGGNHGNSEK